MDEVVYVSRIGITRKGGPVREAALPGGGTPSASACTRTSPSTTRRFERVSAGRHDALVT